MKSRLYNADYTPLYIVEVTVSGNEPEYGTPYTNKERHYFSNKEDARRAMMHFFKWERESFYQGEVKIGDDEIYLERVESPFHALHRRVKTFQINTTIYFSI